MMSAMLACIGAQGIRPVADRVFPLAEIRHAFEYFATGRHLGKVCVTI